MTSISFCNECKWSFRLRKNGLRPTPAGSCRPRGVLWGEMVGTCRLLLLLCRALSFLARWRTLTSCCSRLAALPLRDANLALGCVHSTVLAEFGPAFGSPRSASQGLAPHSLTHGEEDPSQNLSYERRSCRKRQYQRFRAVVQG